MSRSTLPSLSTIDLATVTGGGTTVSRDQYTRSTIGTYLLTGGPAATLTKIADRVRYQFDSDPGNFDRYRATIQTRPGGEEYLAAMRDRDSHPQ